MCILLGIWNIFSIQGEFLNAITLKGNNIFHIRFYAIYSAEILKRIYIYLVYIVLGIYFTWYLFYDSVNESSNGSDLSNEDEEDDNNNKNDVSSAKAADTTLDESTAEPYVDALSHLSGYGGSPGFQSSARMSAQSTPRSHFDSYSFFF